MYNYGDGFFTIQENVGTPHSRPPGPSARQGCPPVAASWQIASDHLLQENFLVRKCFYDLCHALPVHGQTDVMQARHTQHSCASLCHNINYKLYKMFRYIIITLFYSI